MTLRFVAAPLHCFRTAGETWRAFEPEVPDLSFFQSWTWVGCLAAERYDDPVLLRAEDAAGRLCGLALFNRHEGRLCLAESGDPARDAPFIEHNAPLLAARAGQGALAGLLAAAQRLRGGARLVLSGVVPALHAAAPGTAFRCQAREAPWIDLDAVRGAGGDWMAALSANTRYQLRRSARHYAAAGPLLVQPARDTAEAKAWLDALIALHEATWRGRGLPGAFSTPWLRRFHHALVAEAASRGELSLLRVAAGGSVIGYLYNFHLRDRVYAYQSGFAYAEAGQHARPGLTCHALAIGRALSEGARSYDFLAGPDRYKRSLANASATLVWAEMVPRWSPRGLAARLRRALRRVTPPAAAPPPPQAHP